MNIKPAELVDYGPSHFRVNRAAYSDPQVFDQEMDRIFHSNWAYVAHESEIPESGDYLTTTLGRFPVIVSRDEGGDVHVLLNRCMHRAAVVCRADRGKSNHFRCVYHNWVYSNTGSLIGAAQSSGYDDDTFDADALSLVEARVGICRGLIFASFNHDVEPLEERLEHVVKYIDAWANRSPVGHISIPRGCHRAEYPGNWKTQVENGVDGYHGTYVHESFTRILERSGDQKRSELHQARGTVSEDNNAVGMPRGDAMLERRFGTIGVFDFTDWEDYLESVRSAHGEDQFDDIFMMRNVLIFPNLFLFDSHIRVVRPVSLDHTIVDNYPTWLDGAPDEMNEARLREHERFFGPASFGATDDLEIFAHVQTGLQGGAAEWLDLSRGLNRERERGVERLGHSTDEQPQRAIYQGWLERMTADDLR